MPYGSNDWLALTQEPTLEPTLPICDPHHHFWDRRPASIPYQRYLLHELNDDIYSGHNVISTVFLEARSMYSEDATDELRSVGEVEFVQGLAAASASGVYGPSRAAAGIMGHADLKLGADVAPVLDALQAASPNRFRGIRHNITWNNDPAWENRENEGVVTSPKFIEGAQVLSQKGLRLDIMQSFPQMPEIAEFAKAVPDLPIIVNHVGGVSRVGIYGGKDDEIIPVWRDGVTALAACPNVTMKLGGLGMPRFGFGWHARETPIGSEELAEAMKPWMRHCIEQFGPDRCMFESNFPPDKVSFSYNIMYNAFKLLSKDYSATERAALLHDTAVRVYGI
ncbi:MAG: amidohydrolase family protein [Dehalococcoidia bacterium]|nr:amidohydrolase family protein [Dehalococcoidia bacterium]